MNLCHDAIADNQRRIKKLVLALFIFLVFCLSTLPLVSCFFAKYLKTVEYRQHVLHLQIEKKREIERYQQALQEKIQYQKKGEEASALAQRRWRWRGQILSAFASNPADQILLHKIQWSHCELRLEGQGMREVDFKKSMAFIVNRWKKENAYKVSHWQALDGAPWNVEFEVEFKQCLI